MKTKIMTKLEIAKNIIKNNYKLADCGIFNWKGQESDIRDTIYDNDGLKIDICLEYEYFEVFGLTDKDFKKLQNYYEKLLEQKS